MKSGHARRSRLGFLLRSTASGRTDKNSRRTATASSIAPGDPASPCSETPLCQERLPERCSHVPQSSEMRAGPVPRVSHTPLGRQAIGEEFAESVLQRGVFWTHRPRINGRRLGTESRVEGFKGTVAFFVDTRIGTVPAQSRPRPGHDRLTQRRRGELWFSL
jgi:hypothetical protein